MKSFICLTLIICIANCGIITRVQNVQKVQKINPDNARDFAIGFLLAFRAIEKMPSLIPCAMDSQGIQDNLAKIKELLQMGGIHNTIAAIELTITTIRSLSSDCIQLSQELQAYIAEIVGIATGKDFKKNAEQYLFNNAEIVGRDIAEFFYSEKVGDWVGAGAYLGDVFRIAFWGESGM